MGSFLLMCLALSYKERLKMMVLREEFFPFMEEVKNSVAVMTKGANGDISNASQLPSLLHHPVLI